MRRKDIQGKSIRKIEVNKSSFYLVEDLLKELDGIKIDTDKILEIDNKKYVKLRDVLSKTDFDNKITQALNFDPKNK